jgi:hypothetical protein
VHRLARDPGGDTGYTAAHHADRPIVAMGFIIADLLRAFILGWIGDHPQAGRHALGLRRLRKTRNQTQTTFLKLPERIEALGLILLIALLVWRLMEHTMRTELKATDTALPGWDNKPCKRPTSYMLTWKFRGIIVLRIGEERRLAQPLSATQEAFLKALKVPASCFTQAEPWV